MWPFDVALKRELAYALAERDALLARMRDAELRLAQQAAIIAAFRHWAEGQPDPELRVCFCSPTRWRAWMHGEMAGEDGVVATSDDDLIPNHGRYSP